MDGWITPPQEHSFFPPEHNSYSRINFMLLDSKLVKNVVTLHYILISDHATVYLDIRFNHRKCACIWRFDNTILKDKSFLKHMSDMLPDIMATNDAGEISDSIL